MLWHIVKYYIGFVIAVFFKRYKVKNASYLKARGPIILAMNHPNAFMDPVAFSALVFPPKVNYLARGDAFKKGIITTILESLGIIPIYRIQDGGKEGLKKNDETYNRVNNLLKRNKKIIIFAEGLCIQERRLRPLKKGVPRMVFGAMEAENLQNLMVVPVGLNYTDPSQFRGTLFCNIGKPIYMKDYMAAYKEAPAKTMNEFLADLAPRMKELIVHINYHRSEGVIKHIEDIYRYTFYKKEKLRFKNLEHDFIFSTKVVEIINKAEDEQPDKVVSLYEKTKHYTNQLKKYNIRNWLINPKKQPQINYFTFSLRLLFIILTLPLYFVGLIASYLPYKLTHIITTKKVKIIEFKASFNMGIGGLLFLIYYIMHFFIINALVPHILWTLFVLCIYIVCSIYCLYISPFRKKTMGMLRLLKLKSNHPQVFNDLSKQREEIIKSFEELI